MAIPGMGPFNFSSRRPSGRLLAQLLQRASEKRKKRQGVAGQGGGGANLKGIMDGIASITKALGGGGGKAGGASGGACGGEGANGGGRAGGGG